MPHWIALVLVVLQTAAAMAAPVAGASERDGVARPLIVAVAEGPPFAIKEDDGTWSGLSVDLWREVAGQLNLRFDLREIELEQTDALLHDGAVDVALGAVAVSAEGESAHDFSQPYYTTGLGFAEPATGGPSWRSSIAALSDSHLLHVAALIAAATVLVGVLIAFIERRHNADQFGGPLPRGIATGVWWAAVTMTTVGYGDATPKTAPGRSLALVWMFVGVAAVAIFTATVTSILTVGSLRSAAQHPADLAHLRLGAVNGAAGAEFLTRRHLGFAPFETYEEALGGLADRRVDAVVGNTPSLRYLVSRQWQGVLRVSPIVLERVSYAFGLPSVFPLREAIDRTLLRIVEQTRWRDVEQQYLGS
jgi:ABC-type amino acid transport substrate-binding protein